MRLWSIDSFRVLFAHASPKKSYWEGDEISHTAIITIQAMLFLFKTHLFNPCTILSKSLTLHERE